MNNSSFSYRNELDGLRALAVIPVVFYHTGISLFSGGFVGVDVFFVISGYLITNVILSDDDDHLSYEGVYFISREWEGQPDFRFKQ